MFSFGGTRPEVVATDYSDLAKLLVFLNHQVKGRYLINPAESDFQTERFFVTKSSFERLAKQQA